jgi:hypothetical protein
MNKKEHARMLAWYGRDEIIDEITKGRIIFIRWNPDYCKLNGNRFVKHRPERLELLKKLIFYIVNKTDWEDNENIMVYYMFYNRDNEAVTKSLPYKMVYEITDF